jgi:hypothetical protein
MLATYHRITAGQSMASVRAARDAGPPKTLTVSETLALKKELRQDRAFLAHSWRKFEQSFRRYTKARDVARWTLTAR